jgi:hypothetical protein
VLGFTSEDIRFVLSLLAEEDKRRGGAGFGYSQHDPIGKLQAGFSIMLQVTSESEARDARRATAEKQS